MPVIKNGRTILVGEDDLDVRSYLETALTCQGYSVELAQDGEEVLACFRSADITISAIVLDVSMPRKDGIEALKEIRRFNKDVPVIMISGDPTTLSVVESMKNGASDFVCKPIKPEDLRKALNAVFNNRTSALPNPPNSGNGGPANTGSGSATTEMFFGASPQMRELQSLAAEIGWCEAPVLIVGETGVGKEVIARDLHAKSPRAKKPMLKVNCAALPSELVESELFGYERGAFTGAFQKKPGMFERADGSTILLDEIGDMDFKLQAKLLQVLQDQEFQRLGGKETIHVNVRIIAATHRDLEQAIMENAFREDLYYRLNVINVWVPPLRERKEDILPMAEFLMRQYISPGANPPQIPPILREAFLEYHWPGNVRELQNVIRKFVVLHDPELIIRGLRARMGARGAAVGGVSPAASLAIEPDPQIPALPVSAGSSSLQGSPFILQRVAKAKLEAERTAIISVLESTHWNRTKASVLLNIDYKALIYKIKRLGIQTTKPRSAKACPCGPERQLGG